MLRGVDASCSYQRFAEFLDGICDPNFLDCLRQVGRLLVSFIIVHRFSSGLKCSGSSQRRNLDFLHELSGYV